MLNWLRKLICPEPPPCPECPEPYDELHAATAYFSSDSPGGQRDADQVVIGFIERCRDTLDIAIYSLTWEPITNAIIEAHDRGVEIRVLVDKAQGRGTYSRVDELLEAGVNVILDRRSGLMHNKFAIGDTSAILTGSYNWTSGATNNHVENFVVLRMEHIINDYQAEFDFLWKHNLPD